MTDTAEMKDDRQQEGMISRIRSAFTEAQNRQIRVTEEDDPKTEALLIEMVTCIPDVHEQMVCIENTLNPPKPRQTEESDCYMCTVVFDPSDRVLTAWAESLIHSVLTNSSGKIETAASELVEHLLTQEQNAKLRWGKGYDREEAFNKWQKLRTLVYDGFSDSGLHLRLQPNTDAEAKFRQKYGRYIEDMDTFLESLKTMKGKELRRFHAKTFASSSVSLKEFFNVCAELVPERKGEKGWNYEAIKKHSIT